jgi:alpha-tubulin suppressor-like RCC1 family protein
VCGLTAAGEAFCWGAYAAGQLGNAAAEEQSTPLRSAADLKLTSLALGGNTHTCAIDGQKAAFCWGNDTFGQLGTGTKTNAAQRSPMAVNGGHGFTTLALGAHFTCGLDGAGAAWCWGGNDAGQLGDGTTAEHLEPVAVQGGLHFTALTAGDSHACGLLADGTTRCWGSNAFGQLGTGSSGGNQPTPVALSGGVKLSALSGGEEFTCGIGVDHVAYCWGSNRSGWLGDGTELPRLAPTPVKPL